METLAFLKIALFIIIAVTSLASYFTYSGRRRETAQTLKGLRDDLQPLRQISNEEIDALLPLLEDPAKPGTKLSLDSKDVYLLEGDYMRHGLEGNSSTWHDTIAGVEVILPFDAALFLGQHNQAEVVLAGNHAAVVRLNNGFDLLGGLARQQQVQQQNDNWAAGKSGTLSPAPSYNLQFPQGENATDTQADSLAVDEASISITADTPDSGIHIISQREESPEESLYRKGRGYGLLSALCWIPAFILLSFSQDSSSAGPSLLAASLALIGLGCWLFWRRQKPGTPEKINRVSAPLSKTLLPNVERPDLPHQQYLLGANMAIELPKHWEASADRMLGQQVQADLRVSDYKALNLGLRLSIADEVKRFPLAYWGRHLTLALVGAAALFWVLGVSPGARLDAMLAYHWLKGSDAQQYDSSAALLAAQPGAGSLLSLEFQGRCQVVPPVPGWGYHRIDCDLIRWDGAAMQVETPELNETVQTLYQGGFAQTRRDRMVEQLFRIRNGGSLRSATPVVVTNLREIAELINSACTLSASGDASRQSRHYCSQLQSILMHDMQLPWGLRGLDWDEFHATLTAPDQTDAEWEAIILNSNLEQLYSRARAMVSELMTDNTELFAKRLVAAQQGGVLLQQIDSSDNRSYYYRGQQDTTKLWEDLQYYSSEDGLQTLQIEGMLVSNQQHEDGSPLLLIDTARTIDNGWPATVRTLWLLLALLLVGVHGVLTARGLSAKEEREKALAKHCQTL
ncbi:IgaA/UmoB family intracellular growth attenuator [Pseudomonas jilinensis]|uniref:Intracellular growth attenuator protein igaA n=1 Tax=Pseudomonas jilinensis TaxID=2078689 RepID=A0A396RX34_9PSED|nr:IgaA/UmoB family intracellular growth attenuator [Pseudomonas jilinensis]RHW21167.1 hypothetical protein C2846_10600 [Pseudomonas jilinensis]